MLVAAHRSDLRTAYVSRPLEYEPGRAVRMPAEGVFDVLASDFLDLADQLGA